MKVKFSKVQLSEAEAEIPTECPECEADLAGDGAIVQGNYNFCGVRGHIDGDTGEFEGEGESDFSDEYHPIDYRCGNCGHLLAGEGIDGPTEE